MFKHPFSFKGRIKRTEYCISLLVMPILMLSSDLYLIRPCGLILFILLLVIGLWFFFAQSAKRCHDIGKSGWYQIPVFNFGIIEMLFKEGFVGDNEYGPDPRQTQKEVN